MIFATETSCDETSCAIYDPQTKTLLSNVVFSQFIHKKYGGVVPEHASAWHLSKISLIAQEALDKAQIKLSDITAFCATNKPGLPGSLLIGVCFTKALAWAQKKAFLGVNHLEGHIFSPFLEKEVPFPHICLLASGGHTALYLVTNFGEYTLLEHTLDDSAGEAFDKVAKLLGLEYPGGPIIEEYAALVNFKDFYHYPRAMAKSHNFSFSGIKTAVLYSLIENNWYDVVNKKIFPSCSPQEKYTIASSLLVCIRDIFQEKIRNTLSKYPDVKAITFTGGVACNKFLKNSLGALAREYQIDFVSPSSLLCADNAGMIAFVGNYKNIQSKTACLDYRVNVF